MATSTSTTAAAPSQAKASNPSLGRLAGALLMITPILLVAALIGSMVLFSAGTAGPETIRSPMWLAFWSSILASFLACGVGGFIGLRQRIQGLTGSLLGGISLTQVPLALLLIGISTYATRRLVAGAPPDQVGFAIKITEATSEGILLALHTVFGITIAALGFAMTRVNAGPRAIASVAMALGAIAIGVNVAAMLSGIGDWLPLGIVSAVVASLSLLPIGWSHVRTPARAAKSA